VLSAARGIALYHLSWWKYYLGLGVGFLIGRFT
jgi:hypothetical protein